MLGEINVRALTCTALPRLLIQLWALEHDLGGPRESGGFGLDDARPRRQRPDLEAPTEAAPSRYIHRPARPSQSASKSRPSRAPRNSLLLGGIELTKLLLQSRLEIRHGLERKDGEGVGGGVGERLPLVGEVLHGEVVHFTHAHTLLKRVGR